MRYLFGYPISKNLRRRIAKKYFNRYWQTDKDYLEYLKQFENVKVGDLVNTCTGLNGIITAIEPDYIQVGKGELLLSIDLDTSVGGCNFRHCGIQLPKTKQEIEKKIKEYLEYPYARQANWDIRYSPEVLTINEDGLCIINYELERKLIEEREGR